MKENKKRKYQARFLIVIEIEHTLEYWILCLFFSCQEHFQTGSRVLFDLQWGTFALYAAALVFFPYSVHTSACKLC